MIIAIRLLPSQIGIEIAFAELVNFLITLAQMMRGKKPLRASTVMTNLVLRPLRKLIR